MLRQPAEFHLEYFVSGQISGICQIPDIRYFQFLPDIHLFGKFAIRQIPTTNQGWSFPKLAEDKQILFLESAVKIKMLTFVLPTEKHLVILFLTVFQVSRQPRRIRKNRDHQKFFDAGVSF